MENKRLPVDKNKISWNRKRCQPLSEAILSNLSHTLLLMNNAMELIEKMVIVCFSTFIVRKNLHNL